MFLVVPVEERSAEGPSILLVTGRAVLFGVRHSKCRNVAQDPNPQDSPNDRRAEEESVDLGYISASLDFAENRFELAPPEEVPHFVRGSAKYRRSYWGPRPERVARGNRTVHPRRLERPAH